MLEFKATNNKAEYEALLAGFAIAKELGVSKVDVYTNSLLVINQVTGEYLAKWDKLKLYLQWVWEWRDRFQYFSICQIPWEEIWWVNKLAQVASEMEESSPMERDNTRTENPIHRMQGVDDRGDCLGVGTWRREVSHHRRTSWGKYSSKEAEVKGTQIHHNGWNIIQKGFSSPLYVLHMQRRWAIHDGRGIQRNLRESFKRQRIVAEADKGRCYWPSALKDAEELFRKCTKCQMHATVPRCPLKELIALCIIRYGNCGTHAIGKMSQVHGLHHRLL